eukprot:TRINITY_DN5879_c0_g1_i1.p1 TRINITY_DN5879_c0_g1~~TRINITY_DN5879_c0_g1_i1.p1  ORF type:complete len:843 (+),score=292.85 TRINITY_DN5879_c0_g1_i1:230-2530(+)
MRDVQVDWYKVLGYTPALTAYPGQLTPGAPALYVGTLGSCPWLAEQFDLSSCELWRGAEAHCVVEANGSVVATGNGTLGAVFALYTLSEVLLGVDPWYRFTERQPPYRPSITVPEGYATVVPPPFFRYRGAFTNDEDLLGYFRPDPLAESVFDMRTWDNIYETLLRMKANMVVPGTSTNPDERHLRLASRRGLAVSQSHFEIAGFGAREWLNGDAAPRPLYNWSTSPDLMAHVWRAGIDAMRDLNVIWTVGLRGLWDYKYCEKGLPAADCGQLITTAMANQTQMIREAQPDARIITYLWDEGLQLWKDGYIKIPEGVQLLFTDEGVGYIGGLDNASESRGLYYHTAMLNGLSNQLTEMIPPARIFDQLGKFVKQLKRAFYIVDNISDLWPVLMTTEAVLKLAWDPTRFAGDPAAAQHAFIKEWTGRRYGLHLAESATKAWELYFAIPNVAEGNSDEWIGENLGGVAGNAANDWRRWGNVTNTTYATAAAAAQKVAKSVAAAAATLSAAEAVLQAAADPSGRAMVTRHLYYNAALQKHGSDAVASVAASVVAAAAGNLSAARDGVASALTSIDALFAAQRTAEGSGEWRGLFFGDRLSYSSLQTRRRTVLDWQVALTNCSLPAPTNFLPGYYSFYDYQKPAVENYPLFYKSERYRASDFVLMNCTSPGGSTGPDGGTFSGTGEVSMWTTRCRTENTLRPLPECAPAVVVRYTTDGSPPTASSAAYSAPVRITKTTAFSAAVQVNGSLHSLVRNATFWSTQGAAAARA